MNESINQSIKQASKQASKQAIKLYKKSCRPVDLWNTPSLFVGIIVSEIHKQNSLISGQKSSDLTFLIFLYRNISLVTVYPHNDIRYSKFSKNTTELSLNLHQ